MDFNLSGQPPGLVAFFSNKFCGLCMLHWCTHRCWSHFSLPNLVALKYESLCSANHYKWTKILRHLNVYLPLCISVEQLKVYVMLVVVNFGNYCRNICGNHISIIYFPVRFENTTSISFPVALPSKPEMYVWKQNWVTLDLTVFCDHFQPIPWPTEYKNMASGCTVHTAILHTIKNIADWLNMILISSI